MNLDKNVYKPNFWLIFIFFSVLVTCFTIVPLYLIIYHPDYARSTLNWEHIRRPIPGGIYTIFVGGLIILFFTVPRLIGINKTEIIIDSQFLQIISPLKGLTPGGIPQNSHRILTIPWNRIEKIEYNNLNITIFYKEGLIYLPILERLNDFFHNISIYLEVDKIYYKNIYAKRKTNNLSTTRKINELINMLRKDPANNKLKRELFLNYYAGGIWKKTISLGKKLSEVYDKDCDLMYKLANACFWQNDKIDAEPQKYYRKCIGIDYTFKNAYFKLIGIYCLTNDFDKAHDLLEQIQRMFPDLISFQVKEFIQKIIYNRIITSDEEEKIISDIMGFDWPESA